MAPLLVLHIPTLFGLPRTPSFIAITRSVLEAPFAARTADFNEDGNPDIAVGNDLWEAGYITVMLGDGTGSFPVREYIPLSGSMVRDLAVADFDADGHWDIAAVLQLSHRISLLLGDGLGNFEETLVLQTYGAPEYLTSADFNEDGFPDLALSHWVTGEMSVLMNDGAGSFLPEEIYDVGGAPRELDVGDFDEDGNVDITVATMAFNDVYVFLGDGCGSFPAYEMIPVDYDAYVVRVDDFDADGHDDIAVGTKHSFLLLEGDGEGNFTRSFEKEIFDPHAIVAEDFDEDGKLDAGVAMTAGNLFEVYLGTGTGSFLEETVCFDLPDGPRSLGKADFNKDGHQDLVAANEYSNDLTALINQVNLLHITTEPEQGLHEHGDDVALSFLIENPQDTLVQAHVWFTLEVEGGECFIDPELLEPAENPIALSLEAGSQAEYALVYHIPEDMCKGSHKFYVNIGDCGYSPEEWPSREEGGARTPIHTSLVYSSGKIGFHVVEGSGEGEEEGQSP